MGKGVGLPERLASWNHSERSTHEKLLFLRIGPFLRISLSPAVGPAFPLLSLAVGRAFPTPLPGSEPSPSQLSDSGAQIPTGEA